MSAARIATTFSDLCKAGQFDEAGARFWADDIVSYEPNEPMRVARGRHAVEAKGA